MNKQLVLFNAALGDERNPGEFLKESVKSEVLALMTRVLIAMHLNEKEGDSHDKRDTEQGQC